MHIKNHPFLKQILGTLGGAALALCLYTAYKHVVVAVASVLPQEVVIAWHPERLEPLVKEIKTSLSH